MCQIIFFQRFWAQIKERRTIHGVDGRDLVWCSGILVCLATGRQREINKIHLQ